ncbi:unnamed protein product [Meloidogyne enterolobii]|uniref:Uncharacterized protein n=1 Tax=Meloidogyne enterolobii TaxID=390850 RepID=A0ACB0YVB1_MELEN
MLHFNFNFLSLFISFYSTSSFASFFIIIFIFPAIFSCKDTSDLLLTYLPIFYIFSAIHPSVSFLVKPPTALLP